MKGTIEGTWSETELLISLRAAGYRVAPYQRGGSWAKWIVSRQGEHMGSVKLTKAGAASFDFMYYAIDSLKR